MAHLIIVYWRDIPAQIIAERGKGRKREKAKVELDRRFAQAIDAAAMESGLSESSDYLSYWRKSPPVECGESLNSEVASLAKKLENEYDKKKLSTLIKNGGVEAL